MRRLLLLTALTGLISAGSFPSAPRRVPHAASADSSDSDDSLHFKVPFGVGEKMTYQAKLNFINAGSASMDVEDVEPVRGHLTYHTAFDVRGRMLFLHVTDHYESWFDTATLVSLHHTKHMDETKYKADFDYEFHPETKSYVRNGVEFPSVAQPLDEGSFIYFMRSLPLEVGKTYRFNRYYHPDRNPVIVRVDRKEHITVPAGEFDAIVLKPVIQTKGLFAEKADAEVWLSDDSTRTLLRLKSKLPFGTLYLELKQAVYPGRR
jgi:hypothetical protein